MVVSVAVLLGGSLLAGCGGQDQVRLPAAEPAADDAPGPSGSMVYYWNSDQPECPYLELDRVRVVIPDGSAAGAPAQQRAAAEGLLGRAARGIGREGLLAGGDRRPDRHEPVPDGVIGIVQTGARSFEGWTFSFTDPECRR
ncbi:MAG: hypothetical protein R6X25_14760 [Candidatus Krumholzibacteriia bacterium]